MREGNAESRPLGEAGPSQSGRHARILIADDDLVTGVPSADPWGDVMGLPFELWRTVAPRFPVRVPAVSEPVGGPGGPDVGEVENLSRTGMLLRLTKTLLPGAKVEVALSPCRRPPLFLTGTVIWVRPRSRYPGWALGIQFSEELPGELVAEIAHEEFPPWPAFG